MSAAAKIADMLRRDRPESMFPPLAYDAESQLFMLEGSTKKKQNFLGAAFIGMPCAGVDSSTAERLTGACSIPCPPGTIIQIQLLVTPDIDQMLSLYSGARTTITPESSGMSREQCEMVLEMAYRRAEYLRQSKEKPLIASQGVRSNSATVIVSIKVPTRLIPDEEDFAVVNTLVDKIMEGVSGIGVDAYRLDAGGYLRWLRRITHMYDDVTDDYHDDRLIRDQVMSPGDEIETGRGHLKINDTYIKSMSVKYFPKMASIAAMNYLIGDPRGQGNMIADPFMMSLTLLYPDQYNVTSSVRRKSANINYQALGPMTRFIPRLALKKDGIDVLVNAIEEGATVIQMNWTLHLYGKSLEEVNKASSMIRTYYGSIGWDIHEERAICWPMFWNSMPLFPSQESIGQTFRFHTMGVRHAMQFAPVLSEWRGTGVGATHTFSTRRGQPMLIDFFDSDTSYNALLFAESGAGKSFLTQQIVCDLLSVGAKVWVIDIGRSYLKLAKMLNAEFIEFSEDSKCVLNPFSTVIDLDEDLELLKAMIAKMAAPTQGLDDYAMSVVEEAIKAVWGRMASSMTVSEVADYLLNRADQRAKDIGTMLYPFTRHGSYGAWFDGVSNLEFGNNFVVLEMEELSAKKHLQQVVLLQLIAKIQHSMFLNESGQKQYLIVDEAWASLSDGGVAKFLAEGYRRFRKYNAGCMIVSQSLLDMYQSRNTEAIVENAPHLLVMQQKHETIDAVRNAGKLGIGDYGFHMMKSVHSSAGKYSEVLFYTRRGWGVGRFVADRFTQVCFSTKGKERSEVMADMANGVPPVAAIAGYIDRHG